MTEQPPSRLTDQGQQVPSGLKDTRERQPDHDGPQ